MAKTISQAARDELQQLEATVAANCYLANLTVHLSDDPGTMAEYSFVAHYLSGHLHERFERFHRLISSELIPLVADVKAASSAGG